jgi:3-oxoacyl-[acyl-carrier protein] reductase
MHARASTKERLGDAVADAAGTTDHENLLAAEIQFVHRARLPFFLAGLTSLGIGASVVNPAVRTASSSASIAMSDFKQLSRSVRGLTVLVTGAASGMGRASALVFAAEGAKVAVTDHAADGAEAVAGEITQRGGIAKAWTLDVASRDDINAVVGAVASHFGGLDIVVNNAGISVRVAIDDDGYEEAWAKALAVMLTAHPRIIRAALPYLRRSKSPRIVNIASTEALGATALHSPYSAAKAGVAGLTRSLAVELGREGITVNCICPGPIRTAITERISEEHKTIYAKRRTALGRYGDPEEVAHMTLSLCLPAASFLTGAVIPVDGGLMARNA